MNRGVFIVLCIFVIKNERMKISELNSQLQKPEIEQQSTWKESTRKEIIKKQKLIS